MDYSRLFFSGLSAISSSGRRRRPSSMIMMPSSLLDADLSEHEKSRPRPSSMSLRTPNRKKSSSANGSFLKLGRPRQKPQGPRSVSASSKYDSDVDVFPPPQKELPQTPSVFDSDVDIELLSSASSHSSMSSISTKPIHLKLIDTTAPEKLESFLHFPSPVESPVYAHPWHDRRVSLPARPHTLRRTSITVGDADYVSREAEDRTELMTEEWDGEQDRDWRQVVDDIFQGDNCLFPVSP
ncbi:hypothetical protein B0H21DRAFT_230713 [Amylocystis lapponica]|nr:hypothetical protein B0H21DRAFT_230713 [Amylocystis lapponica]